MFERLKRSIRAFGRNDPDRRTRASAGGTSKNLFAPQDRSRAKLREYRTIYEQGGIVAELADAYAMYTITNGYRLEGEDKDEVAETQAKLDAIKFHDLVWSAVVDGNGWAGDAMQEIVLTKGGEFFGVEARDPSTFEIDADEFGNVIQYRQVFGDGFGDEGTAIEPDRIIRFSPRRLSGKVYGEPLIKRAYDEIMRDAETAEATRKAIKRHGTAKWHVKVAPQHEGDSVADDLPVIKREFEDIESKNEFVTDDKVAVEALDTAGAGPVAEYNDIASQRLCAAMGVPEEMIGLRRGSSDATASTRMQAFYGKIGTLQRQLSDTYNTQLIDRLTGRPGAVKLVFNDVNPADEAAKSLWITRIMRSTGAQPFAVLPREWVANQFGISPDVLEPYDPFAVAAPPPTEPEPIDEPLDQEPATPPAGEPAELEAHQLAKDVPDEETVIATTENDLEKIIERIREKVLRAVEGLA